MKTGLGQMDGNEWETYCQKLLRIKYQSEHYQEVPAQFGGDLGIEGFTRSGIVFQCYSPDENLSGKDLYEHQRDKITRDISKLIKNAEKIHNLGTGPIREWQFLTPEYNSRYLLDHCRAKEVDVLDKGLLVVHPKFQVLLKTEDDFIPERQILLGSAGYKIQPSNDEPPDDEVKKLLKSKNEIVVKIQTKLGRMDLSLGEQAVYTRQLVEDYVVGRAELQILNQKYPQTFSAIVQLKTATESQLPIRTISARVNNGEILRQVLNEYEEKLAADFSSALAASLISRLAMEALTDWLGRCPLRIPERETSE